MITWNGTREAGTTDASRLAELKEKFKDYAEPFRSAIAWMKDDQLVPDAPLSYWAPVPWDNHGGLVTLAGDAAHSMPPRKLAKV